MSPRRTGAALLLVLVATACGVPSQPGAADWDGTARQSLDDTASEVETVRLLLQAEGDGRLLGRSGQVSAAESEEAAGKAAQTVTTLQPPPSRGDESAKLADLLERAGGLLTDARIAITAQRSSEYDDLRQDLAGVSDDLDAMKQDLR